MTDRPDADGIGSDPRSALAELTARDLPGCVEAVLMSVDRPIGATKLASALGLEDESRIAGAIDRLNAAYDADRRSFRIESVAGGYRVMTLPRYGQVVRAFHEARSSSRLSRAAMETLAIIAYKQPITRATLEAIRGVACGEVLRTLLDRRLITIAGRAEELGRPMLYGTSKDFLSAFGLSSIKDLPTSVEAAPQTTAAGDDSCTAP